MSHMRRPLPASSSASNSNRPRASLGGAAAEQTTPRSALGLSSPRPRSSLSMIERPVSLGGRGLVEQSASGMARPSPLSARPLPPGRSTSGGKRAAGANSPIPFGDSSEISGASEVLESALRREVEEKEELMMRLSNRDDAIARLESRIADLDVNMVQGEARLTELYADQERWEAERAALEREIAKKTTVIDKLRIQLRELEKENKECSRRLTEQAAQFESERQAFYDNTTHLKSRIQSLTDQQRDWKERLREEEEELKQEAVLEEETPEAEPEADVAPEKPSVESPVVPARRRAAHHRIRSSIDRDATELPEMTALKLELSTLNTSHGSLGQTVKMLQGQLADLERVNLTLQEENEAYTTLLREKTLNGQMNILARGRSRSPSPAPSNREQQPEQEQEQEEGEGEESETKSGLLSPMQSPPPRVRTHSRASRPSRAISPARSARSGKSARRATVETLAAETLADLPVAGPGLDLAAELGRAVIINLEDDLGEPREPEAPKEDEAMKTMKTELEALKTEIKTLKEENKGLTLYASKIIDRIIAHEEFEHILAVDYRKPKDEKPPAPTPTPAPAPRKSLFQRAASLSISSPSPPVITARPPLKITTDSSVNGAPGPDSPATPMGKREKRGISMDWSRLNPFGAKGPSTPIEDVRTSGLKPLTLGKTPSVKEEEPHLIHGGRKLDNQEDEDDRVERERLQAEMKLMGIERTTNIHTPSATSFAAAGQALVDPVSRSSSSTPSLGGMVGWGKRPNSGPSQKPLAGGRVPTGELRAEHLELLSDDGHSLHSADYEVREVENRMAALAEREKHLSAEMAKGKSGGFTEPPARGTRVRRRTNSTAGSVTSTLFSAGRMSRGGSDVGIGEEPEHE